MTSRRNFIRHSALAGMALSLPAGFSRIVPERPYFSYESPYVKLQLKKDKPRFAFFSTDSLGMSQFDINPLMIDAAGPSGEFESRVGRDHIAYFAKSGSRKTAVWECHPASKVLSFRTRWESGEAADPFTVIFSQKLNHCTVLGKMTGENRIKFPCVLHFPGMGSFRIFASDPGVSLFYDAELTGKPYIKIALPAADSEHPDITYRFESVAIFPALGRLSHDPRFDGYRKNYINIFQLSPRRKILSNNSTSDACAFTVFLYAEMAMATPILAEGLTAMDLVRDTLDHYFEGMLGYGMVGKPNWQSKYDSSDCYPSLVMSACYYILHTRDTGWANKNYAGIKVWATKILKTDRNQDGLIEYGYSGNSGSWDAHQFKRPANWWDTIGFGHDDAYSNALAYRACTLLSQVAGTLNKPGDQKIYDGFAKKIKAAYFKAFYHGKTGVLAGWRSEDGQLHDYYFTFVNAIAICYGLIDKEQGVKIMTALLDKMKAVGYTDFRLGLPGNLIPIDDRDYVTNDPRWGYQKFQVYENGGATGCYVYYTIHALYMLGMNQQAEKLFLAMMDSYQTRGFEGNCPGSTMTKDWKTWEGACWGYEGFLVDNYLAMLAMDDYLKAS